MNRLFYDFHIHSCLSPCSDDDMTPANIVNMAKLKGLGAIALTDHNTCGNCKAAYAMAKNEGLLFLPGMELCTSEEAHILCLFEDLDGALGFENYIYPFLPDIKNRPDIYGRQLKMDENDEVIGEEPKLLLNAVSISAEGLQALADSYGGVALPAHIDRESYSLYHSLGCIPEEYGFSYVELSSKCDEEFINSNKDLKGRFQILRNSDAHNLADIAEPEHFLLSDKNELNSHYVVNMLKNKPVNR